jgi:hypothetical protein
VAINLLSELRKQEATGSKPIGLNTMSSCTNWLTQKHSTSKGQQYCHISTVTITPLEIHSSHSISIFII